MLERVSKSEDEKTSPTLLWKARKKQVGAPQALSCPFPGPEKSPPPLDATWRTGAATLPIAES